MNTLDLLGATRGARYIVRLMLRQKQVSYSEMREQINLTQEELDEGIEDMLSRGWMYVQEVDGENVYSLELQKKEGSEVTRKGKDSSASSKISELWDKVDDGAAGTDEGREAQREMTAFHQEKRQSESGLEALDELANDSDGPSSPVHDIKPVDTSDTASEDMVKPLLSSASEPTQESSTPPPEDDEDQPGGLRGLIRRLFKK
jgi:hypothetical protein